MDYVFLPAFERGTLYFKKGTFFIQRRSVVRAYWAGFERNHLGLCLGERIKLSALISPPPSRPGAQMKGVFQRGQRQGGGSVVRVHWTRGCREVASCLRVWVCGEEVREIQPPTSPPHTVLRTATEQIKPLFVHLSLGFRWCSMARVTGPH